MQGTQPRSRGGSRGPARLGCGINHLLYGQWVCLVRVAGLLCPLSPLPMACLLAQDLSCDGVGHCAFGGSSSQPDNSRWFGQGCPWPGWPKCVNGLPDACPGRQPLGAWAGTLSCLVALCTLSWCRAVPERRRPRGHDPGLLLPHCIVHHPEWEGPVHGQVHNQYIL